jgi:hypothetical protein
VVHSAALLLVAGSALYFAMVLPWFIAVQHQNPTFFREFFLEHNLERFATNRYEHQQPFWYYLVVVLLAVMPWTVIAVRALIDGIQTSVCEWRARRSLQLQALRRPPRRCFPEFLVLWALIPIVFFSFSQSKLPGYILPSIPPITILTGDYLFRRRQRGLNRWVLMGHAVLCGVMTMFALLLPWFVAHGAADAAPACAGGGAAGLHRRGAADPVVVKGFGVAGCGWSPPACWWCWSVSLWRRPVLRHSGHRPDQAGDSPAGPLLLRAPAGRAAGRVAPATRRSRSFASGATSSTGSRSTAIARWSTTRRAACRMSSTCWWRVTGRGGVDLHTPAALEEYLEGRHYEQLFSWPEQGLVVYMVGSR